MFPQETSPHKLSVLSVWIQGMLPPRLSSQLRTTSHQRLPPAKEVSRKWRSSFSFKTSRIADANKPLRFSCCKSHILLDQHSTLSMASCRDALPPPVDRTIGKKTNYNNSHGNKPSAPLRLHTPFHYDKNGSSDPFGYFHQRREWML